jgi:hypothetical protein
MKVKELIEQLNKLNPDLEVVCYSEDNAAIRKNQLFFTIDNIAAIKAEISRNDDGLPLIKFQGDSHELVLLEMIADD